MQALIKTFIMMKNWESLIAFLVLRMSFYLYFSSLLYIFITLYMTKSIHFDKHEFEPIWPQFIGDPAIMGSTTQISTVKIMGSIFQGCLFLGVEILNA